MEVKPMMDSFLSWLQAIEDSAYSGEFSRTWCMFDMTSTPTQANLLTHFDRKAQNDEYVKRMTQGALETLKPASFLQANINLIYGVHKCMVARHKSRLMHYRDDIAHKGYHTRLSLVFGLGTLYSNTNAAENVNSGGG